MAKRFVPVLFFCAVVLLASCGEAASRRGASSYRGLEELDGYVAARPVYETRKRDQLEGIRKLAASTRSNRRLFDYGLYAANEYFSYSFDSTQFYLKQCLDLAESIGDWDRYNQASILLGHLYAKSGHYMEAYNRLFGQIDTNTLSEPLREEYLWTLYDFSRDLAGNSGMVERPPIQERDVYRQQLYKLIAKDSRHWRELRLDELASAGRLESADSLCRVMLASVDPAEHTYAIYAYEMSVIAEQQGRPVERMDWLIKSAECDILNAIKDYASLTVIAQELLNTDLDRSFRYLRVAQEDAIFYNAKLRPWQISQFFMGIEDAYSARQERARERSMVSSILLSVLTFILLLLAWFLISRSRKLARMQQTLKGSNAQLAEVNERLGELNRQLSRADNVKEKYIVDFLRRFSANISLWQSEDNRARNLLKQGKADQLLRELSLSTRSEKGLKDFYRTFDSTFLAICPDFVSRFNELLREDARFSPKEGTLNTELRIFALIRLGVDDSREIAELLHYSQSTIYNYKVSVKNAALGDRDQFEERVKQIGK
ncbi:MAG: hypothetical protein IKX62_01610 [Bacteroidales bacterium]|nr:hypothetical protein [Bacteroidales bacterium]